MTWKTCLQIKLSIGFLSAALILLQLLQFLPSVIPRVEAVQKQIREAETVQAIAQLRLVWAEYQKRVFLLSNLPVEMPVDHLIEFNGLMPDRHQTNANLFRQPWEKWILRAV